MWRLQISNFEIKPKYRDNPNTCLSYCLTVCLSVCLLLRWVLLILIIFFTNFSIESLLNRPFSQTWSAIVIIHVPANTSTVYLCKSESFRDVLCKLLLPYEIFSKMFLSLLQCSQSPSSLFEECFSPHSTFAWLAVSQWSRVHQVPRSPA